MGETHSGNALSGLVFLADDRPTAAALGYLLAAPLGLTCMHHTFSGLSLAIERTEV
jgi:hypothetical protein